VGYGFVVVSELGSHGVGQAREVLLQFRILVLGFVTLWDFFYAGLFGVDRCGPRLRGVS